jgi:hypothetical protein
MTVVNARHNIQADQFTGSNESDIVAWLNNWVTWANANEYCADTIALSHGVSNGVLTLAVSPGWLGMNFELQTGDWLMCTQGAWQRVAEATFDQQWVITP